jgi:hypothetical protein
MSDTEWTLVLILSEKRKTGKRFSAGEQAIADILYAKAKRKGWV